MFSQYLYAHIHSNLFKTAQIWKRPKYSSLGERITHLGYSIIRDYYSAIQRIVMFIAEESQK